MGTIGLGTLVYLTGIAFIKRTIANAACHASIGSLVSYTYSNRIKTAGILIDTSHPLIVPAVKAQLFWGLYERAEARFIRKYLRKDLNVIELGSSLGVISCLIRRILPKTRRLICVEAHPELIGVIQLNLRNNFLADNVLVINKAVYYDGAVDPKVWLSTGPNTLSGKVQTVTERSGLLVEKIKLSEIVEKNAIGEYTLVSDIEGAEAGIILQSQSELANCRQMIIEFHTTDFKGQRIRDDELRDLLLSRHGFSLRDQHGPICVLER